VDIPVEEMLLNNSESRDLDGIMVLKVAHHGWGKTSSEAFLDRVRPGIAVISTGPSRWPLPPEWVLARFGDRDIPLFRTDRLGTVEIICYGSMMQVRAGGKVIGKYALPEMGKDK
jgi:competence protein ComEC